jgi:hypothetical protein
MSKPNFFNENRFRAFPFLAGDVGVGTPETGPISMLQLPDEWIVDCGFILGPESGFDVAEHAVWLERVERTGTMVTFEFRSDAPAIEDVPLIFVRMLSDPQYAIEHVESSGAVDGSVSDEGDGCREPLWSGYLVTGRLDSVSTYLGDGDAIVRSDNEARVEPALLQNQAGSIVNSFELANADRTRITVPDGCDEPSWPFETGSIFIAARCIQGDVRLKAGYNCLLTQDTTQNAITIAAGAGAGEGQPCDEVPLFDGESGPAGATNDLFEGGLLCNETVRSINGIGGPLFSFIAGLGVTIQTDPEANRIVVDYSMVGMALCWSSDASTVSESLSV